MVSFVTHKKRKGKENTREREKEREREEKRERERERERDFPSLLSMHYLPRLNLAVASDGREEAAAGCWSPFSFFAPFFSIFYADFFFCFIGIHLFVNGDGENMLIFPASFIIGEKNGVKR